MFSELSFDCHYGINLRHPVGSFVGYVLDGINTYGAFCRKFDVKVPVVFKTVVKENLEGSHVQPLPVNEMKASFDVLKSNPKIKINIKE